MRPIIWRGPPRTLPKTTHPRRDSGCAMPSSGAGGVPPEGTGTSKAPSM